MSAEKRGAAPNKTSFNHRTQAGGFKWRGMMPDFEPQDLPPDRPYMLQNCRLENGGITGRGGMEEIVDLGKTPTGMTDHQIGTQRSLMMTSVGCPGFSASVGFWIGSYDTEQDPRAQRLTYYDTATFPGVIGTFGDDLYFGVDDVLMKLQPITPPYGTEAIDVSGVNQEVKVWDIPSGYTSITAIHEYNGDLYVALLGSVSTNSAVYKYDGVTFTLSIGGINPITGFATFRELLVAGHNGTTNLLRILNEAGVWSTVAPGSGTVRLVGNSAASYKDNLYVPNTATSIYIYNGTTLTEIAFGTTGMSATAACSAVDVAYGYLYFSWWDATGVFVGRYDGTTWSATHKNLTTQFSLVSGETQTLIFYRGCIAVAIKQTGGMSLLQSPRENTSGTWTEEDLTIGGIVVTITDMVAF